MKPWSHTHDKDGGSRDVFFMGELVAAHVHSADAAQLVAHANAIATPAIEQATAAQIAMWLAGYQGDPKDAPGAILKGEWRCSQSKK